MKLIGKGKNGKAYLTQQGTVLKKTSSKKELDFARWAFENNPSFFVPVLSVECKEIEKALCEEVFECMGVAVETSDNVYDYLHYGTLFPIFAFCRKGLSYDLLLKYSDMNDNKTREVVEFISLNIKEIMQSPISLHDLWSNLGKLNGKIVIYDADSE